MATKTLRRNSKPSLVASVEPSQEIFQAQFQKTVLCKFHAEGRCKMGALCRFAHTWVELREAPDLTKTSLCRLYMKGGCKKTSEECPFAHGMRELRMTPMFQAKRQGHLQQMNNDIYENGGISCAVVGIPLVSIKGVMSSSWSDESTDEEEQWFPAKPVCKPAFRLEQIECVPTKQMSSTPPQSPQGKQNSQTTEDEDESGGSPALPIFFKGSPFSPKAPGAMQELEQLLNRAMPDHYED